MKKKLKRFSNKFKEIMAKINQFMGDFTSDIQLISGILLTVIATFIVFGTGIMLYVLGIFLLILGVIGRFTNL